MLLAIDDLRDALMGHKWYTIKKPIEAVSKPTAKRFKKGPKELLKGVKWEEFFKASWGNLIIEDEAFALRVGYFFHIPACAVIHKGKYVILRRLSMKAWDEPTKKRWDEISSGGGHSFAGSIPDTTIGGRWWAVSNVRGLGLPGSEFVLAKSKFDLLRGD
jgi:hypothetical protein